MVSHKVAGVPVIFVLSLAVLASACGGGEKAAPTPVPTRAAPPTTAPAPTPTPVPQPTGKLTYAIASFATETTVPLLTTVSGAAIHAAPVYDWLVWLDAEGSPVPGIAASWEMASDGRSWTFQLRRNMKFHNDQAITAEDVKFSIEFLNNPKVVDPAALALRPNLDGVDIVSPEVARVRTKNPAPLLIYELTPLAVPGVILPKAYWDQVGGETGFAARPVGSGPWRLTQHDAGARFVYRAVDSPHPYRSRPKYAELEINLVAEESTRVAVVKTGAAQLVDVGPDAAISLKKDGFPVLTIPVSTAGSYLLHETSTPLVAGSPIAKSEVREGLALAVNRQEIADRLFSGLAEPQERYLFAPGTLGFDPAWKPIPFDQNRARQLLQQAGYPSGFALSVFTFPGPGVGWLPTMMEAVAGYWSQIGVRPSIEKGDFTTWLGDRRKDDLGVLRGKAVNLYGTSTATNIAFLRLSYNTTSVNKLFRSPEMDTLLDRVGSTLDSQERVRLLREIAEFALRQYVAVPIVRVSATIGAARTVSGWQPIRHALPGAYLETVTPAR